MKRGDLVSNWRDHILEKIGLEEQGTTKKSIQAHVKKKDKAGAKYVSDYVNMLVEWGILDCFKTGGQKKYRIRLPKKKKIKGKKVAVIFGNQVSLQKLKDAAYDAVQMKNYTTDDVHMNDYIPHEDDNLMIKIALLDHIEEQARENHPKSEITRKNKLTLETD